MAIPASRNTGICLAVILLQQVGLVSAGTCPAFPSGSFHAAAAHRALKCVEPATIIAAQQPVGHLVLSAIQSISSSGATCEHQGTEELKVYVKPQSGSLTIGTSICSLLDLALMPSTNGSVGVQMRLDFDKCSAGPRTASVVMNVVPTPDAVSAGSMLPFWKQACTKQMVTPAPLMAQVMLTFAETLIGNNTCAGDVLASYPNIPKAACRELCIADVQKYSNSFKSKASQENMCMGYSVNAQAAPGTVACKLYKGKSVTALSSPAGQAGVNCWSLAASAKEAKFHESTPAPPSAAQVAYMEGQLPRLNVSVAAASGNILTFSSPDKCFQPFNWITLEDVARSTISVNVKQSEWAALLALLPSKGDRRLSASQDLSATVYADRAVYGVPLPTAAPLAKMGPILPDCKQAPAPPTSMTMTYVLITLALIAGGLGYAVGGGHSQGAMASASKYTAGMGMPMNQQSQAAPNGNPNNSYGPPGAGSPMMTGPSSNAGPGPMMTGPSSNAGPGPMMTGPPSNTAPGPQGPQAGPHGH